MIRLPSARLCLACLPLLLAGNARASIAYGSINNFDTVNDTGVECHGFEIELEDCHSTDITYTYNYNHYGVPVITEDDSIPAHPKVRIRWESARRADGSWAAFTAIPSGPIAPTDGHRFTDPSVNFGGEHFGVGYTVQPSAVAYHWLIDDGAGSLVRGGAVQVSTPTFTYYPPVPGDLAPAQVQAEIVPPEPPEPPTREFGPAVWVKEIRTTTHNSRPVSLRDLVSDDPDDEHDVNWRNGEPDEVEAEWEILQKDYNKADGGNQAVLVAAPEDLDEGDEVVTRRYEFYEYIGPFDDETGEAMGSSVGPDGVHGEGIKEINGVEVDLSTVAVVGDYKGAQMAAVDVDAAVGLIDHLQAGERDTPYTARRVVVEGALPFTSVRAGDLPLGMDFNEVTGILSGTPAISGEYVLGITAGDGVNPPVEKQYTLTIVEAGVVPDATALVDTRVEPVDAGVTSGDGAYPVGSNATVVAAANPGYVFEAWEDNHQVVSRAFAHSLALEVNHSLVARFRAEPTATNLVTVAAFPAEAGRLSGAGAYAPGSNVTVTATANPGFAFRHWAVGTNEVGRAESLSFPASTPVDLVAHFQLIPAALALDVEAGAYFLDWPVTAPGWILEECADLLEGNWVESTLPIQSFATRNRVDVSSTNSVLYLRLSHP